MNKSPDTFSNSLDDQLSDRELLNEADQTIRTLNDAFRQTFEGGRVLMTPGISSLPQSVIVQIIRAVQDYSSFDEGNDPYGTHEFGSLEVKGHTVFWKIDAYDQNMEYGSPDPSNPEITCRVMTILLSEEY